MEPELSPALQSLAAELDALGAEARQTTPHTPTSAARTSKSSARSVAAEWALSTSPANFRWNAP